MAISVGFVVGVYTSSLLSAERVEWPLPLFRELTQLTRLEPIEVLPHTELALTALDARSALNAGRPWRAWRLLRDRVDDPEAPAGYVLIAARAASEWEGWENVHDLLADREWLDEASNGEGLLLLGRAEAGLGHPDAAAAAFRRYLALPNASSRGIAQARLGEVLRGSGDHAGAAAAFAAAAESFPKIQDWFHVLQVEQLTAADDRSAIELAARGVGGSAPVRLRRAEAEVQGRLASGDVALALGRLEWERRVLSGEGAAPEAAKLQLDRGKLLLQEGQRMAALREMRAVAWENDAPTSLRRAAADAMGGVSGLAVEDELARVAAYEAVGQPQLAAKSLEAVLAASSSRQPRMRLKLGSLLYAANDFGDARSAFLTAADELSDPELRAQARLYAARSLYRSGNHAGGIAELKEVAENSPETAAAATSLFLLGDISSTVERGLSYYRRAAAIESAPAAREALYRVGDRNLRLGNRSAARVAWEEYVRRYPTGDETARIAYETAGLYEAADQDSRANAMYHAAMLADPVSYYAFRAGEKIGGDPLGPALTEPRPWVGLAADQPDALVVLERLKSLEHVGLDRAWSEELAAARRDFRNRPAALLALAEGLRDANHPVEAISIGRDLLAARGGEWDPRLLRVVYPFLYRRLLTDQAERVGIDPMFLAGLVRQESSFRYDARSWVGATGLGQIMPSTGRWLADAADVRGYDPKLLEVPEINLRMAAVYMNDLLDRYDGAEDLALAAYNAGPGRADRWRRQFHHDRDVDAFREAIPFNETRNYVKLVLRNEAIYQRLYGNPR